MNRLDVNTFYPLRKGSGLESTYCPYNNGESSFDDLDDSQDDQESTEYENEANEVDGVTGENEPAQPGKCSFWDFRNQVKIKKQELKNQYGKGRISIGECGVQPMRISYAPNIKIPKIYAPSRDCGLNPDLRPAFWKVPCVCTKSDCDCRLGSGCCNDNKNKDSAKASAWAEFSACRDESGKVLNPGTENEDAYDRATGRWNDAMAVWNKCRQENKGIWVPGWRRKWREFKKAGGLNELRDQCRGVVPPTIVHDSAPPRSCADMERDFDIIAGVSWGTADPAIRNEWVAKGCKGTAKKTQEKGTYTPGMSCRDMMTEFSIIPGQSWGTAPVEAINAWKSNACTGKETNESNERGLRPEQEPANNNKMYIIIGVIVLVVIATMFIIKRQMK